MISGRFTFSSLRRLFAVSAIFLFASMPLHASSSIPQALMDKSVAEWLSLTPTVASTNVLLVKYGGPPPAELGGQPSGAAGLSSLHASMGSVVKHQYTLIPWQVVLIPPTKTLPEAAALYAAHPGVKFVEPNYTLKLLDTRPNDTQYGNLWGMERINAPQAWDITTGSSNIIVAVIDTGVRYTHEDLKENMWVNPAPGPMNDVYGAAWTGGYGAMTSGDPMDTNGHGTHVAGTIGAVGNNLLGVAGVNWRVRIMALKFLDPGGSTTDAIAAIEYAIQKGAHLTNNSWGGGGYSGALRDVIAAAGLANQLFVAAAGNDSQNMDLNNSYPAGYDVDNIIAVASIAESGALSGFSNFGATRVHIAAPGSFIYSTWSTSDNAYNSISGTSMACPHVAGAAALLLGQVPTLTYAELRAIILDTARPNPNLVGRVVTNGELDLWAAMQQTGSNLSLDREAYQSDATVTVTLFDPLIDALVMMVPADWQVLTPLGGIRSFGTVNLDRQGDSAQFVGSFLLPGPPDALHDDTLVVTYTSGGGDVLSDEALIDDVPPVILDAWVDNITFGTFDVYVTTDEDTRAEIRIGRTPPPAEQTLVNNTFTTNHLFSVAGLEEMSRYYIYIEVEDYAGNITRAPVDPASLVAAEYLSAFTLKRDVFYAIDFERGTGGWTAVSLYGADCWEYGEQQYGPEPPKRMWGTRLNGRYPSEVNATLVSPRFETGSAPVLQLRHWFEMQRTGDWIGSRWNQKADAGMVEVLLDGVWQSIMPYTDDAVMGSFTRSSGGWMTSLFYLPPAFAHKSLQIRFRFLSDEFEFADGNPAGWYIDGVDVSGTGGQGIFISGVEVVDPPLDGDGDGYAEPDETVNLTIQIANLTGVDFDSVTAKMSVFSEGAVSEFVTLVDGTPAQLDFGALLNADYAADGPVTMAIAVDVDPDTRVGIELALEAVVGGVTNRYAASHMLAIEPRETLSGTVTDLQTGLPIQDAVVVAQRGMTRHEALTGADGRYTLTGLRSAVTHAVTASKPGVYSPETKRVYVPITGDVDFSLGAAVGALAPDPLVVGVLIGETAEGVFTLTNTGTMPLEYSARLELPDELIERADVVHLAPTEGVVGPGDSVELRVTVRTGDIMPGAYNIDLIVDSNDVLGLPLTAQLQLTILERPALKFVSARGQTGAFPWLVPGVNGEVRVTLENLNAFSPASGTTGTLSIPDPAHGVIVGAPGMTWPVIPPGGSSESLNGVVVQPDAALLHGDMIGFLLDVIDSAGMAYTFTFELPVYFFGSVNGEVTCTHWAKDGLSFEVRPASNVTVIAENTLGETVATAQTDADGLYTINNLRAEWHWFRVRTPPRPEPPEDEDEAAVWVPGPYYIALEGRAVEVGVDPVADLQMVDYGQDAPFPLFAFRDGA
jgi:subtilisin family serine protease